jgi:hypothetical protein
MDAPKCRLCGQRHWGACANSPSVRAIAGERGHTALRPLPAAAKAQVKASAKVKPKGKAKKPGKKAEKAAAKRAVAREYKNPSAFFNKEGSKRGRPLASEAHLSVEHNKPWEAEGMSRRTWYRRKALA